MWATTHIGYYLLDSRLHGNNDMMTTRGKMRMQTSNNLEHPKNPKSGLNIGSTAIRKQKVEHIKEKESDALFRRSGRMLGSLTTGRDILAHCVKI